MAGTRVKVPAWGIGIVLSLLVSIMCSVNAQAVDSCPTASWKELPFLKFGSSHSPDYFMNMTSWSGSQFKDWAMSLISHIQANLAFLAMVLMSLLAFITWRLVVCCCHGCYCCGSKQNNMKPGDPTNGYSAGYAPYQPPEQQLKLLKGEVPSSGNDTHTLKGRVVSCYQSHNSNKIMAWLKPIILLMAVAAIVLVIVGMAKTHQDLASDAWQQFNKTEGLVNQITVKANIMLDTAAQLSTLVSNIQTDLSSMNASTTVQATLTAMNAQLSSMISSYQSKVTDIQVKVNTQITNVQTGSKHDMVNNADGWRYKAMELMYGVGLLLLLCLIMAMALNLPALLTLTVLFLHFVMILWFLIALIAAVVLTAGHELCPATEVIIISAAGSQYSPLLQYYFFNQGGNLTLALQQAGIVDITALDTQMDALQLEVSAQLLQQQVNLTVSVTAQINQIPAIMADMKAAEADLLAAASYDQVNPVYVSVKGYLCCTVAGEMGQAWQCLTGAAWVTLVMVWLTNWLITQYDRAPGSGKRCGWTIMHPFPPPTNRIHPVDGSPMVVQLSPYPPEALPPSGPYIGAYFPPAQMQQAVPWASVGDAEPTRPSQQLAPAPGHASLQPPDADVAAGHSLPLASTSGRHPEQQPHVLEHQHSQAASQRVTSRPASAANQYPHVAPATAGQ